MGKLCRYKWKKFSVGKNARPPVSTDPSAAVLSQTFETIREAAQIATGSARESRD
jgi:hypothetical protein